MEKCSECGLLCLERNDAKNALGSLHTHRNPETQWNGFVNLAYVNDAQTWLLNQMTP